MRIPVILLSGFLGSGKTTLLLTMLEESKGRGMQPGVLMNELGKRDVDGFILQEHSSIGVEKLLDGCVCCTRKEELLDSLLVLHKNQPDIIYIELTGVADPEEIEKTLQEPSLRDKLILHYAVTLVDAENALEYNSRLSADKQLIKTMRKQVTTADLIVVNKSDLVEPEILWKIEKVIRKHNREAEIVFTHYSKINLSPLFSGITTRALHAPVSLHTPQEMGSFSQVAAVTLTFPETSNRLISKEQLENFFEDWRGILLRAKGHVRLSEQEPIQLVQYSGMRTTWESSRYPGLPYVVFIGMNLNEAQLSNRWFALFKP